MISKHTYPEKEQLKTPSQPTTGVTFPSTENSIGFSKVNGRRRAVNNTIDELIQSCLMKEKGAKQAINRVQKTNSELLEELGTQATRKPHREKDKFKNNNDLKQKYKELKKEHLLVLQQNQFLATENQQLKRKLIQSKGNEQSIMMAELNRLKQENEELRLKTLTLIQMKRK